MSVLFGPGLVQVRLRVSDRDAVFVRSILEAYEGLGSLYGDGTGYLILTAPKERERELHALIDDLRQEGVALSPVDDPAVF